MSFGKSFIILWAGPDYESAYYIALVTLIPLAVPLIQNTGLSIVIAQNKHQFRSITYLVIAIINAISTYLVVPYWGGLGAAVCSGISYVLGQVIIMNIYYYKVTKLNVPLFWKNIGKMSVIPMFMIVLGVWGNSVIDLESWGGLIMGIFIYSVVYSVGMYFMAMNDYERDVVRKPINKILIKIGVKEYK